MAIQVFAAPRHEMSTNFSHLHSSDSPFNYFHLNRFVSTRYTGACAIQNNSEKTTRQGVVSYSLSTAYGSKYLGWYGTGVSALPTDPARSTFAGILRLSLLSSKDTFKHCSASLHLKSSLDIPQGCRTFQLTTAKYHKTLTKTVLLLLTGRNLNTILMYLLFPSHTLFTY